LLSHVISFHLLQNSWHVISFHLLQNSWLRRQRLLVIS
jgi:hypothetical protein